MFEESVEGFVARWRRDAAEVHLFARVENDPLIEFQAGGAVIHALERTGPYVPHVGPANVIVHMMTEELAVDPGGVPGVEMTGVSRGSVHGSVERIVEDRLVVVDAGFRVVVGVHAPLPFGLAEGDRVSFEILPPVQAFVISEFRTSRHSDEI